MKRVKFLRYGGLFVFIGSTISLIIIFIMIQHWVSSMSVLLTTIGVGLTAINTSYAIESNLKDKEKSIK